MATGDYLREITRAAAGKRGWTRKDAYSVLASAAIGREALVASVEAFGAIASDMLGCLNHRERRMLEFRLGLATGSPMTLEAVGKEWGLHKETVRLILRAALKKLRTQANEDLAAPLVAM